MCVTKEGSVIATRLQAARQEIAAIVFDLCGFARHHNDACPSAAVCPHADRMRNGACAHVPYQHRYDTYTRALALALDCGRIDHAGFRARMDIVTAAEAELARIDLAANAFFAMRRGHYPLLASMQDAEQTTGISHPEDLNQADLHAHFRVLQKKAVAPLIALKEELLIDLLPSEDESTS